MAIPYGMPTNPVSHLENNPRTDGTSSKSVLLCGADACQVARRANVYEHALVALHGRHAQVVKRSSDDISQIQLPPGRKSN